MGVPKRRSRGRALKTTILIVGEGDKTEPNYFRELRREDAVATRFAVTVKKGRGRSPEAVVREAVQHKKRQKSGGEGYDEVWCVVDVEGPANRQLIGDAEKLARRNGVTLCLSNPCFEIWLLAHFERTAKPYNDCKETIEQLKKHWREHCGQDYRKNDDRLYHRVAARTPTAIANAKWVRETHFRNTRSTADCNSSTDVYRLVGRLIP